jgi:hypothetical protein
VIGTPQYAEFYDLGIGGGYQMEEQQPQVEQEQLENAEGEEDNPANEQGHISAIRESDLDQEGYTRKSSSEAYDSALVIKQPRKSSYDDNDGEEDAYDDEEEEKPSAPKSTGNSLKDMLHAQIRNRQGGAEESKDRNTNEESSASASARKSISLPTQPVFPQSRVEKEEEEEEGEEEDPNDDLFSTQDDPYSLFGSRPSSVNKFAAKVFRFLERMNSYTLCIYFYLDASFIFV